MTLSPWMDQLLAALLIGAGWLVGVYGLITASRGVPAKRRVLGLTWPGALLVLVSFVLGTLGALKAADDAKQQRVRDRNADVAATLLTQLHRAVTGEQKAQISKILQLIEAPSSDAEGRSTARPGNPMAANPSAGQLPATSAMLALRIDTMLTLGQTRRFSFPCTGGEALRLTVAEPVDEDPGRPLTYMSFLDLAGKGMVEMSRSRAFYADQTPASSGMCAVVLTGTGGRGRVTVRVDRLP